MKSKPWLLPVMLLLVEVIIYLAFRLESLEIYSLIWGLIFGFLVVEKFTGLGCKLFGQGQINHHAQYQSVQSVSENKVLKIYFEDVLIIGFALVNIGLCVIITYIF